MNINISIYGAKHYIYIYGLSAGGTWYLSSQILGKRSADWETNEKGRRVAFSVKLR